MSKGPPPVEPNQKHNARFEEFTGTPDDSLSLYMIEQMRRALLFTSSTTTAEKQQARLGAIAQLRALKPTDALEGTLGVQMVATHASAMECLGRANKVDDPLTIREFHFRHACKLLTIYCRQMEILNKHRGKGQQKIILEYVNAEQRAPIITAGVARAISVKEQEPLTLESVEGEALTVSLELSAADGDEGTQEFARLEQ